MSTLEHYLDDLGSLLKEQALEAKRQHETAPVEEKCFCAGRLLAYNEVLSLMISQALAFGIDPEVINLSGFDPDQEL
jgi:hypothetical protein